MNIMIPDDLFAGPALPWHLGALLFGFLLGSLPMGVMLARLFGLGDLRAIGSGNVGATNVLRTGNKRAALLTLLLDMLKGFLAVTLAAQFYGPQMGLLAGAGAVFGHCLSPFLGFRGGKGVASFLGMMFGLDWRFGLMGCGIWLLAALITRISSLAALTMTAIMPVLLYVRGEHGLVLIVVLLAAFIWLRHRANILRLLSGDEARIWTGGEGR